MSRKKDTFNWKGILQNTDGTFTAEGKREKRRLLKSLHDQGVGVRSRQNQDGTWTVTPYGNLRQTRSQARSSRWQASGRRPEYAALPKMKRYPASAAGRRQLGPQPTVGYGGGSMFGRRSGSGKGILDRMIERRAAKRSEQEQAYRERKITEEKMKQDRIAAERKETAEQIRKQEYTRKRYENQNPGLKTAIARADVKADKRHTDDLIKRQQAARDSRQSAMMNQGGWQGQSNIKAPQIPSQTQKHDAIINEKIIDAANR